MTSVSFPAPALQLGLPGALLRRAEQGDLTEIVLWLRESNPDLF